VVYELKPGIQKLIEEARIGDVELNARTKADPRLAEIIARETKNIYELGLEKAKEAAGWPDYYNQWTIGKYAVFDCFIPANDKAKRLAGGITD